MKDQTITPGLREQLANYNHKYEPLTVDEFKRILSNSMSTNIREDINKIVEEHGSNKNKTLYLVNKYIADNNLKVVKRVAEDIEKDELVVKYFLVGENDVIYKLSKFNRS